MTVQLLTGDCRAVMSEMESDSVDAIVTDPPAGIAFMGKSWDHDKGGRDNWVAWLADVMREAYRLAKPGAHAVVWALPRTSGWTHRALEDAGWEVRDCVVHLFGSGFPKSLDVSKAIDKQAGAEREVIGRRAVTRDISGGSWSDLHGKPNNATEIDITAPATPEAERWAGWGTALKPAAEFWYLARKPLSERTVAANVLAHGTGALNIDGTRIEITDGATMARNNRPGENGWKNSSGGPNRAAIMGEPEGRWPANVALDEAAAEMLDAQSGERPSRPGGSTSASRSVYGVYGDKQPAPNRYVAKDDTGGASRFFYVAKASRRERNAGLDGMPERGRPGDDHNLLASTFRTDPRSPNGGYENKPAPPQANHHPTVKPIALMRWLVRLVTPPGGVVLDPFMGSGSTGIAADREGFSFIGIEQNPEYVEIARRRIVGDAPLFVDPETA